MKKSTEEKQEAVVFNKTKHNEMWKVDPRNIKIQEGLNIRKINPESEDMLRLMDSIKEHGVKRPLVVMDNPTRAEDGIEYVVVDGHRRLTAVKALIESGLDIAYVLTQGMSKGVAEEEIVLSMFTLNEGEPLNPLEKAEGVRRLIDVHGYSPADVAKKISESEATVSNLRRIASMPMKVKKRIAEEQVSASLALKVARKCNSEAEFVQAIEHICEIEGLEELSEAVGGSVEPIIDTETEVTVLGVETGESPKKPKTPKKGGTKSAAQKAKAILGADSPLALLTASIYQVCETYDCSATTMLTELAYVMNNKPTKKALSKVLTDYLDSLQ